ncbi:MAG: redoxin domain-containing protein [Planctomycetaceae bacterium]
MLSLILSASLALPIGDLTVQTKSIDEKPIVIESGQNNATVVCFLGTECPMARLYGPRLSELASEFAGQKVQFVGINSNRQDSKEEIAEYVQQLKIRFPVINDEGNQIADRYSAKRTPEVFVLDSELNVIYHGAIDDQYAPGVSKSAPKRQHLRIALKEHLSGRTVSVPTTEATGCLIGRVRKPKPNPKGITYTKQVSRILAKHCVECHRQGEIGPFALEDFDEVVGWADTMMEVIDNSRMPPWHADPKFGHFANAREMPESDKQILRDWIAAGTPKGDQADMPERLEYVQGWSLSKEPDVILPMRNRPYVVPADGTVEYQYFVVDPGFTEDKWISAAQAIPGARSVVHHIIVFVRPPDGERFRGVGWLTAYVPGQRLVDLPPAHARKVPAGSKLVFQMHYTPTGVETPDISKVGLVFAEEKDVTHECYTLVGIDQEFEIPPDAANHKVRAKVNWLPEHGRLLGITPHMHYRGKGFQLYTDAAAKQTLLSVPSYDFNWQHTYQLAEPIPLNDVEKLHFDVTFDNSAGNPFNPDPKQWVTWVDQTWEEMAVAFF